MTESKITVSSGGAVTFEGPDAIQLFRANQIRSALGLHKTGMRMSRGVTNRILFEQASQITGKKYKMKDFDRAREDLKIWIDAMKAAMPIQHSEGLVSGVRAG